VAALDDLDRVRYITCHPRFFGDDLIEVVATVPKVSRYLHLPCQAGSDTVLDRMNRRYTRDDYLALVDAIRAAAPAINLSSDFIVGFPGETEEDFQSTLGLIRRVRFGQVFAFAYSPRPGTRAASLEETVPASEKKERLQRLFELANQISFDLNQELVGQEVAVLIDGPSRRSAGDWQGRGGDNRVVNFPRRPGSKVGEIVAVRITSAGPHSLRGEQLGAGSSLPVLSAS
jgi:tRNA-2-methylthio-N6-dimethylallyladenosine synthase